jgi:hypothetical protein
VNGFASKQMQTGGAVFSAAVPRWMGMPAHWRGGGAGQEKTVAVW